MRIGIYTHYAHCDQTYFALRLVEFFHSRGVEFSIYPDNQPGKLKLPYDRTVVSRSHVKFTEWAKKQNAIIWTHVPRVEQINFAKKANALTILAPMWQELIKPFKKAMVAADSVVSMNTECMALFQDIYRIRHTSLIPFDTGLPITRKTTKVNERNIRLFLPWFDRNARCASSGFLAILIFLLENMPDAQLTVGITTSRFAPAVIKFFERASKRCGGRIQVIKNKEYAKRASMYVNQDLTLWPGECDNYGLCPLTSITMGTPVLTLSLSPQTDFIAPETNGVLVKTRIDYDENGVVHAVPEYEKFGRVLQELIAEPKYINDLNQKTAYNLSIRRRAFEAGWAELLGLV